MQRAFRGSARLACARLARPPISLQRRLEQTQSSQAPKPKSAAASRSKEFKKREERGRQAVSEAETEPLPNVAPPSTDINQGVLVGAEGYDGTVLASTHPTSGAVCYILGVENYNPACATELRSLLKSIKPDTVLVGLSEEKYNEITDLDSWENNPQPIPSFKERFNPLHIQKSFYLGIIALARSQNVYQPCIDYAAQNPKAKVIPVDRDYNDSYNRAFIQTVQKKRKKATRTEEQAHDDQYTEEERVNQEEFLTACKGYVSGHKVLSDLNADGVAQLRTMQEKCAEMPAPKYRFNTAAALDSEKHELLSFAMLEHGKTARKLVLVCEKGLIVGTRRRFLNEDVQKEWEDGESHKRDAELRAPVSWAKMILAALFRYSKIMLVPAIPIGYFVQSYGIAAAVYGLPTLIGAYVLQKENVKLRKNALAFYDKIVELDGDWYDPEVEEPDEETKPWDTSAEETATKIKQGLKRVG